MAMQQQAGGGENGERRTSTARVHFEALVAVGGEGGGGFDAESVDVSTDGMRLRTAFLPELGEKLVCRFDGPGLEVVAEGEVAWRTEESKGGEFGLRFTDLSPEAIDAVRALGTPESDPDADADAAARIASGTRVRLHIEGLASPMKARVRGSADSARGSAANDLEVGSNLEFLKLGRTLQLEDVDKGARREALIDQVKIEVDPQTSVPQLVVSLRYSGGDASDEAAPTVKKVDKAPASKAVTRPMTRVTEGASRSRGIEEDETVDAGDGDGEPKHGAAAALEKMTRAGKAAADKVGPAIAIAGSKTRDAMLGLIASVQKRRGEMAEAKKASAPRRMTAPPPGGALKSEGRRLVRDDGVEEEELAPTPRVNRRAALIGSALGLIAVLFVFFVSGKLRHHDAAAKAETGAAAAAMPSNATAGAQPTGAAGPINVPLFGATPPSTTEIVPPPAPSAVASAAPDAPAAGDGDGDAKPTMVTEWGQGKISHPKVLKIKMDGELQGLVGASGAMGFTISVPNHRALSTSSDLAKKDKRLASVKVVNTSQGAEISVQFKDGVPAYQARIKGDKLEIALGGSDKKIAKKKSKKKGKHADD